MWFEFVSDFFEDTTDAIDNWESDSKFERWYVGYLVRPATRLVLYALFVVFAVFLPLAMWLVMPAAFYHITGNIFVGGMIGVVVNLVLLFIVWRVFKE